MATATRYFDGSPGRELVMCPDCGEDAVLAVGGDHGGPESCARRRTPDGRIRTDMDEGLARLAEAFIRDAATKYVVFSSNNTRRAMDDNHISVSIRTLVFRRLVGVVMEPVGYEPSTERRPPGRARRDVRTYRSLIHPAAGGRS